MPNVAGGFRYRRWQYPVDFPIDTVAVTVDQRVRDQRATKLMPFSWWERRKSRCS